MAYYASFRQREATAKRVCGEHEWQAKTCFASDVFSHTCLTLASACQKNMFHMGS